MQAKPQRYEQGKRKRNGRDFQAASKGAGCSHRRRGFVSGPPLICRFAVARRIGVPQETKPVGWMDFIFPRRSNTRRSDPGNLAGRLGLLAAPFEGWGGCAGPAPNMQRRRFHDGPAKRQLIHAKYGLHLGGRISASEPAGWDAIPAIICENSSIMGGVLSSPPTGLDGAGPRWPSPHFPSSGPGRANDRSTCKSRGFVPGHVDETCDAPR